MSYKDPTAKKRYNDKYRAENAEKLRLYRASQSEKRRDYSKLYRAENLALCRERDRARYAEVDVTKRRAKRRAHYHKKKSDPHFKLRLYLRNRLRLALQGNAKRGSAVRLLGCTVEELKLHLEKQFQPGMAWDNHGLHGWHIDHIKPLIKFDLTDPQQLAEACHFTNLQPLWAKENLSKGGNTL